MRILYIHQHFATPKGSSGNRSYQMARRMVERGHQITMVCGRGTDGQTGLQGPFQSGIRRGAVEGIDVIEIDLAYSNRDGFLKRSRIFLQFMFRTLRITLTERYDLAFATTTPLTVGVPGIAARWLRRKPFVFEVRDLWPELPRAMGVIRSRAVLSAMGLLEWASYKSAHRLIGLSPGIVEGIVARGIPRERVRMIPNGCDLDLFGSSSSDWTLPGLPEGDLLAIFAGAHGLANGLDRVLDAAAELQRRGRKRIHILLVGTGMCKPALQERAEREGLANVTFLDPVPKTGLGKIFMRADVGLQCLANVPAFYFGTSPNKFFDYLATGLPVLNNYPGWVSEMVAEHRCGIAVPPDDAAAFANALEQMADDRVVLAAMGKNARRLAETRFARDALASEWAEWVEATPALKENEQRTSLAADAGN